MKWLIGLLVTLTFINFSCKSDSPHQTANRTHSFSKDGVSFDIAKDWEITNQKSIMGLGYNVSAQRKGVEESGLVTIVWISQDMDPAVFEESMKAQMKDNDLYKNASIQFGNSIDTTFNKISCRCLYYTATFAKLAHSGAIFTFKQKGKTFAILQQQADEDRQKNVAGFKVIDHSFSVN